MATSSKVATGNMNYSWQESLSNVSEALHAEKYSRVCTITSRILLGAASTINNINPTSITSTSRTSSGSNDNGDSTPLPNDVRKTLQHIYCRALIHLSKYGQVLDYCTTLQRDSSIQGQQQRSALALEEAHALYKLGNYLKCRDFILKKLLKQRQTQEEEVACKEEGLMHILAQCHYRLHETTQASQIYADLMKQQPAIDKKYMNRKNEMMTNALAVDVANFSPPLSSSILPQSSSNTTATTEEEELDHTILSALKQSSSKTDQIFPYELEYNYATHLLLTSSSLSQTKKAMKLLTNAEQECRRDDHDGDEGDEEDRRQRESYIQRNVMPIQANLALGKFLCGDWNGATRAYLQLVLSSKQQNHGIEATSNGGGGAIMAAENNLAVLNLKRGSSCSVFDLLKRLPNVAHGASDMSDGHTSNNNANAGNCGLSKTTPNQVRILLYNRALLFYKMTKFTECKSVLNHLTKALSTDGQQQYQQQQKINAKKKKRKKGKGGVMIGNSRSHSENSELQQQQQDVSSSNGVAPLPAPPANEADSILWQCRIALLESEIVRQSQEGNATCDDADAIVRKATEMITTALKAAPGRNNINNHKATLEYALAELTLYNLEMTTRPASTKTRNTSDNTSEEDQIKMTTGLENLPTSIRERPATIATLSALYSNLGMDEKVADVLDSTLGSGMAQKSLADFKLRLGSYEEAASLYESTILAVVEGKMALSKPDVLECRAGLVKALSYYDIQRAVELASTLPLKQGKIAGRDNETEFDGEELEAMEIPRLSKNSGMSGSGRSNQMRKMLGSSRGRNDPQKKKKKKQEAILRQRAKKRELYLEKLQKEGRYNLDRPIKPDAERWIPKNQRSYAKRGRKGRHKFVGAQGGGIGAGAERDAARLDAMARAVARAEGKDVVTQQPSTAHLSVTSTNGHGGKGSRRR